jgi:hypothetical protein
MSDAVNPMVSGGALVSGSVQGNVSWEPCREASVPRHTSRLGTRSRKRNFRMRICMSPMPRCNNVIVGDPAMRKRPLLIAADLT